jgi:aminodeoxyfutalosine deaminase
VVGQSEMATEVARAAAAGDANDTYPKIELHVHLEATVAPATLLEIAKRNDYPLPVTTVEELAELYRYRDFDHFIEVWILTTNALRRYDDFRQVVVDYAEQAARHGAVYLEGIFSPIERVWRGVDWNEIVAGYCDGAQEARERHGIEVRLTPDITRGAPLDAAFDAVRYAIKYRDRGVAGIGLGGEENLYPPEPFAPAFRARGVQKLCECPRVQFINAINRRLGSPGHQGVISRDLCAARPTSRARLTSTRRIWYSRARVKPIRAYRRGPCCEKVPSRRTE